MNQFRRRLFPSCVFLSRIFASFEGLADFADFADFEGSQISRISQRTFFERERCSYIWKSFTFAECIVHMSCCVVLCHRILFVFNALSS